MNTVVGTINATKKDAGLCDLSKTQCSHLSSRRCKESPFVECPRPEAPRPEAPRPEAPRPEAPRPINTELDGSRLKRALWDDRGRCEPIEEPFAAAAFGNSVAKARPVIIRQPQVARSTTDHPLLTDQQRNAIAVDNVFGDFDDLQTVF